MLYTRLLVHSQLHDILLDLKMSNERTVGQRFRAAQLEVYGCRSTIGVLHTWPSQSLPGTGQSRF